MKAVILAGGFGKRLKPLTDKTCKPMVRILGRPLSEYAVAALKAAGIEEVYFATGYRSEDVESYYGDGRQFGMRFRYRKETTPLGTAGAVRELKEELGEKFLCMPADGLSDVDLGAFSRTNTDGFVGALAVALKDDTTGLGVVNFDDDLVVNSFIEKPLISTKAYVNTGIYMFTSAVFDYITDGFCDFGKNVFPNLSGKLKVFVHNGFWSDVGTLKSYEEACKTVALGEKFKSL